MWLLSYTEQGHGGIFGPFIFLDTPITSACIPVQASYYPKHNTQHTTEPNMENNTNPTVVEEEPPHEMYANLVEKPDSCRYSDDVHGSVDTGVVNAVATAVASRSTSNPDQGGNSRGATLIPVDNYRSEPLTSQFAEFYRKSCREVKRPNDAERSSERTMPLLKSKKTDTGTKHSKKQPCSKLKSKRRRTAQHASKIESRKIKQIRMMLRSDLSELDEILYRGLTR